MIRSVLSLDVSDDVAVAQVDAFKRRVPMMYAILTINMVALAITHYGLVSDILSVYVPATLCGFMAIRCVHWYRSRKAPTDPHGARRALRVTTRIACLVASFTVVWTCFLYTASYDVGQHHDAVMQRGQVVLYVGLTVMCCICLLMNVRMNGALITTIVMVPFCALLLVRGSLVENAIALNLLLVAAGMLYVLFGHTNDFEELIRSRSELRSMNAHQSHLANTDALTSLANRRQFFARFDDLLASGERFALLIVDLDGFKQINDLYGHSVGDDALVTTAARIAATAADAHCVARMGGDEFAIIHPQTDTTELTRIGEALVRACSGQLAAQGVFIKIGASVGISIVPEPAALALSSNLIERADYALSFAKQNGKGRVQIFDPEQERMIRRRGEIEQALLSADLQREIHLVYQPVVSSPSGSVIGFEALARWNSPVLGPVSPGEFVPVAERSALIHDLTMTVLDKALRQAAEWPSPIRMKINLSARDIGSHEQMARIMAAMAQSKVDAKRLTFELTETALETDIEVVTASVKMIRSQGSSLAIDDFGTGYSSLSYVHRLNPDVIKIDRSFVARLCEPDGSPSIIKTITELCRNVGARSLAEGVETAEQSALLARLGVDEMQGYFYGAPARAETIDFGAPRGRLSAA